MTREDGLGGDMLNLLVKVFRYFQEVQPKAFMKQMKGSMMPDAMTVSEQVSEGHTISN
jgi:hypothetical protein